MRFKIGGKVLLQTTATCIVIFFCFFSTIQITFFDFFLLQIASMPINTTTMMVWKEFLLRKLKVR